MTAPGVNARELDLMTRENVQLVAGYHDNLAALIGVPYGIWANRCHEISLALLRTGVFGRGRIARGGCQGVSGQHSWIVLGDNCYDRRATIVDPTLHAHRTDVDGIWVGTAYEVKWHRPHGAGHCFSGGMPTWHGGEFIDLIPAGPLKPSVQSFTAILGPLDCRGWAEVAHMPVGGWPAAEIIGAMLDTPALARLVPVDIQGMVTDRNPGNLYW
jgi:hypothetical protein